MATPRTVEVILAGEPFTVHAFNIEELEIVADILEGPQRKAAFAIVRLALARATPKVDDPKAVEASMSEIREAVPKIMKLAGLEQAAENPPAGGPAAL